MRTDIFLQQLAQRMDGDRKAISQAQAILRSMIDRKLWKQMESSAELLVIEEIAAKMGKIARISLRVNPDIGAHTHANITTGLAENKFGIFHEAIAPTMMNAAATGTL